MSSKQTPNTTSKINRDIESDARKLQVFIQELHDFVPAIEKEIVSLHINNMNKPNDIFPLKMDALALLCAAADPLYKWYVEKSKINM